MANNNNGNGGMNMNDIGMIRNILMGEQITDFEKKFNELQEQMNAMQKQLQDKISALDAANIEASSKMGKDINDKIESIEKLILSSVEKLDKRIDKSSKDDKVRLGKMLDRVSKQLIGE